MFAKVQITGTIEVLTGMHIGANNAFSAIGAVDSPVGSGEVTLFGINVKPKVEDTIII